MAAPQAVKGMAAGLRQGRRKLSRGGAAIGCDARGRTVADSISAQSVEVFFRLFTSATKKLLS